MRAREKDVADAQIEATSAAKEPEAIAKKEAKAKKEAEAIAKKEAKAKKEAEATTEKEAKEKEAKEKELEDAVDEAEVAVVSKINQLLDKMDSTKRMIATAVASAILLHASDKKNLLASAFDVSLIAGALKKSKEGSKRKLAKDTDEDSSGSDEDSKNSKEGKEAQE
jgi:hypothetical protein